MIDAQSYGKALLELTCENKNETQVRDEVNLVRETLHQNPAYIMLMDTPAVGTDEKLRMLGEAFEGLDPMLKNFLCILCEKRAFYQFDACADAFMANFDELHGILRATAVTAVPMSGKQQEALRKKLASITGKTVELSNITDPAALGGVTLRYGGVQLDGSLQTRLETLRRSLAETIV